MKSNLSYRARLALQVNSAASPMVKATFPYGFETYAKIVAKVRQPADSLESKDNSVIEWRN